MKNKMPLMLTLILGTLLSVLSVWVNCCNVSGLYSCSLTPDNGSAVTVSIEKSSVSSSLSSSVTLDFEESGKYKFSDFKDRYYNLVAADVSHLGSLSYNFRTMVKSAARLYYQSSTFWAKAAIRQIAGYIQNKSLLSESYYSKKFRVGITGEHIEYIYLLCRIVI